MEDGKRNDGQTSTLVYEASYTNVVLKATMDGQKQEWFDNRIGKYGKKGLGEE